MKHHIANPSALGGLFFLVFLSATLLVACGGTETEKAAKALTEQCPVEVSAGEITQATAFEEERTVRVDVSVTNPDYDFDVLNSHPAEAREIRSLQLSMYPETSPLGRLVRSAAAEGYQLEVVYRDNDHRNSVSLSPSELRRIAQRSEVESPHLLNIRITIVYMNFVLPRKIDEFSTQDRVFFDNGTLVVHFTLDEQQVDWRRVMVTRGEFRRQLADALRSDCKTNAQQRAVFNQCLAGSYSFAYEYEGSHDSTHRLRLTFPPEEIKKMLIN